MGQIGQGISNMGSSLGQAFSNPNTFAPNPSGFSGSEWAARFLGGAAKGAGQGLQNMSQQRPQGPGAAPMPVMSQQPNVDLSAAVGKWGNTAADQPNPYAKRAQNPFYGSYNPG